MLSEERQLMKWVRIFLVGIFRGGGVGGVAFHFVEIFRFVAMQSVFCLYLQNGLEFFNKFCSSDPSFNRNILRPLYLKFKTSAHAHIAIAYN